MFDSERIAMDMWRKSMDDFGYILNDDLYISNIGRSNEARHQAFMKVYSDKFPFYDIRNLKQRYLEQYIINNEISPMPGLIELISLAEDYKLKLAVASSSEKEIIIQILNKAGISEKFEAIVSGEDITNGKPAPDIFLETAKRLAIAPRDCVVFEDSNAGVQAAHQAGMLTVMVLNLEQPSQDSASKTDRIFSDLLEAKDFLIDFLEKPADT